MWFDAIQPAGKTQKIFVHLSNIDYFQSCHAQWTGLFLKSGKMIEVDGNIVPLQENFTKLMDVDKNGTT